MKRLTQIILCGYLSCPILTQAQTDEIDRKTNHCLGIVWSQGGQLDLMSMIGPDGIPSQELAKLCFVMQIDAKGARTELQNHVLKFGDKAEPADLKPTIYYVELRYGGMDGTIFDRMWIVVNNRNTKENFDKWYNDNKTNMAWTLTLPAPFTSIAVNSGNPVDPEPNAHLWEEPTPKDTLLHPNASFEMRSLPVTGSHGHQAMYDAKGILITSTVAAGTADFVAPYLKIPLTGGITMPRLSTGHLRYDVYPFIRALQLDGNPCWPNSTATPTTLRRPMLYQGDYLNQYIQCRPITPTGTRPRP